MMPFQALRMRGQASEPVDPYWSNVVLLCGFETYTGIGGTTPDDSPIGHTVTLANSGYIGSTAKFGANALATGTATVPDAPSFNFGSGSWTMEGWVRWSVFETGAAHIMGQFRSSNNQRSYEICTNNSGAQLQLFLSSSGSATITKITASVSLSTGVYYHIAADFDGSTYRLYVDGVMVGSATTPITLFDSSEPFTLRAQPGNTFPSNISCDEVRITKGVARYASDSGFAPPTAVFPRS